MIFGFSAKDSLILDSFVDEFNNPKDVNVALMRSSAYLEKRISRLDGLFVVHQRTVVDVFCRFAIVFALGLALLGVLINVSWMVNLGLLFVVLNGAILSPLVWFLSFRLRLFFLGYRGKVELVSKDLLLEKVFYELERR